MNWKYWLIASMSILSNWQTITNSNLCKKNYMFPMKRTRMLLSICRHISRLKNEFLRHRRNIKSKATIKYLNLVSEKQKARAVELLSDYIFLLTTTH